jgi:hypothetical protein
MENTASPLHSRLANCLETILELEPDLEQLELGHVLLAEFGQLKSFLERLDSVCVDEADVTRIEAATSHFLEELKVPLGVIREGEVKRRPLH